MRHVSGVGHAAAAIEGLLHLGETVHDQAAA